MQSKAKTKKYYRSRKNKVLTGLFGGLGEYFNVDATLIRLGWLFVIVLTGFFPGTIVYIIAALIIPKKPK